MSAFGTKLQFSRCSAMSLIGGESTCLDPHSFMLLGAGNFQRRVAFLPWVPARLKALKPKDWTDEPRTLGDHLKKRRREFDLLQREAAVRLGVSVDTYRGWEIGRIRPGPGSWMRIIGWLGYDPTPEPNSIGERLRAKRR